MPPAGPPGRTPAGRALPRTRGAPSGQGAASDSPRPAAPAGGGAAPRGGWLGGAPPPAVRAPRPRGRRGTRPATAVAWCPWSRPDRWTGVSVPGRASGRPPGADRSSRCGIRPTLKAWATKDAGPSVARRPAGSPPAPPAAAPSVRSSDDTRCSARGCRAGSRSPAPTPTAPSSGGHRAKRRTSGAPSAAGSGAAGPTDEHPGTSRATAPRSAEVRPRGCPAVRRSQSYRYSPRHVIGSL